MQDRDGEEMNILLEKSEIIWPWGRG